MSTPTTSPVEQKLKTSNSKIENLNLEFEKRFPKEEFFKNGKIHFPSSFLSRSFYTQSEIALFREKIEISLAERLGYKDISLGNFTECSKDKDLGEESKLSAGLQANHLGQFILNLKNARKRTLSQNYGADKFGRGLIHPYRLWNDLVATERVAYKKKMINKN